MNVQLATLIGSTEAAQILGWSRSKVKQDAAAGRLPYEQKLPGKTGGYLFHRSVIETIAAQEVTV